MVVMERYRTDPEFRARVLATNRNWAYNNWPRYCLSQIKRRCKRDRILFNLVAEDIVVPAVCPVTLRPFIYHTRNHPDNPSLDRIDPTQGYIRGNIQVISRKANMAKQDITDPAFFDRLARLIRKVV